jgi:hypothetical protein
LQVKKTSKASTPKTIERVNINDDDDDDDFFDENDNSEIEAQITAELSRTMSKRARADTIGRIVPMTTPVDTISNDWDVEMRKLLAQLGTYEVMMGQALKEIQEVKEKMQKLL